MLKHTVVLALVVAFLIGTGIILQAQDNGIEPLPVSEPYTGLTTEVALNEVYQSVVDSVVNVSVAGNDAPLGTGSGFIINTDGYIVTNNHVVADAQNVAVTFYDGTIVAAEVVGTDPQADLAVIQIDPNDAPFALEPVLFASSRDVFVGQGTMAIGSPFGQASTMTTGVVSAINRSIRGNEGFSIPEVIQTDAAINPGNSGGPLMNLAGEVIGVNAAILSASGSGSGVGFAIPADTVRRIVPYLIQDGEYQHSYLGISGAPLTPWQRDVMQLPAEVNGVMVADVVGGGPGADAALQGAETTINTPFGEQPIQGDVITAVDGNPVQQMNDLVAYLEDNTQPGDTVTLTIWRNGEQIDVPVTLAERPSSLDPMEES